MFNKYQYVSGIDWDIACQMKLILKLSCPQVFLGILSQMWPIMWGTLIHLPV